MDRLKGKKTAKEVTLNILLMFAGSVVCAIAVNGILIPNKFMSGGFTGIALVIHYIFPPFSIGLIYLIINIPVFILGWLYVGRRFFFYSIAGMLLYSFTLTFIEIKIPLNDMILCAVAGGIISGIGAGIILKSLGSAGGLDVLSIIFLKRFSLKIGHSLLILNCLILVTGAFVVSLERVLYTMIYMYVQSNIINIVVTGLSQRKAVLIISNKPEQISDSILRCINRGVTIIEGHGGYTGYETKILYTVISLRELPRLKRLLNDIDKNVFMVVLDTMEVMGNRIGNQPHW
ncbi:MAG: YitT family protein [Desulfobacteraceae bacterium]